MFIQDFLNGISVYLTLPTCHPLFPEVDLHCHSTYTIPVVGLGSATRTEPTSFWLCCEQTLEFTLTPT